MNPASFSSLFDAAADRAPVPIGEAVASIIPALGHAPRSNVDGPPGSSLSARANPWQRVGRAFAPTSNADEALHRSGLNWAVEKVGLRCDDLTPVADRVAIRRCDTGKVLGIVGRDYEPLQNADAFAFFRDLAGEAQISFETAGAFDHGSITWVQVRLPDLGIRIGDDISESYLFISNGHTGNRMLTVAPTTIRIICKNSLRMAEAQGSDARQHRHGLEAGFTVRHTKGMHEALIDIRDAYAKTLRSHAATKRAYEHLAGKRITKKLTDRFLSAVFEAGVGPDESGRARAIKANRRARIDNILESETSMVRGTTGSAFSLFQAAVEYVDHDRVTRTNDGEDAVEKRLVSATFGSGADRKAAAWDAILDLTKA